MLNSDINHQVPLDSESVIGRYKNDESAEVQQFRRFKDVEDKNKNKIKAELKKLNKEKSEQEAKEGDDKKKEQKGAVKIQQLGELLTTDFNGKPMAVKKLVGGCLARPLSGFCKGPDYEVKQDQPKEDEKPNANKKKKKTITKAQLQLIELRKA